MKRVYGYKKRVGFGKRYQDGFHATARNAPVVVIEKETLPTTDKQENDEEIELKVGAGVNEPVVEQPVIEDKPSEPQEEETGELPKHFTGFMPTDNVQPTVSEPTPEEAVEPED